MRHTDPQFDSFDLAKPDEVGIRLFDEYIWQNRELCNHCFTRVREIDANLAAAQLPANSLRNLPEADQRKTRDSVSEHTPWPHEENPKYGKTFCLNCASDMTADHRDRTLEDLTPFVGNLYGYVSDHTPIELDTRIFATTLVELKRTPDHQGRETQMLAVAFARGVTNDPPTNRYYWSVRQVAGPA